jgi:hypothetical protein
MECICVFRIMIVIANIDCVSKQHYPDGACSGDIMCFLWGTNVTLYIMWNKLLKILIILTGKRQIRPLIREGGPQTQDSNCQTVTNFWSWEPEGARHQDTLTDRPSAVTLLWLWQYCIVAVGRRQRSHCWVRVPQDSIFYDLKFETPSTWKDRFPYLYSPGTRWPSYTLSHWVLSASNLRPSQRGHPT